MCREQAKANVHYLVFKDWFIKIYIFVFEHQFFGLIWFIFYYFLDFISFLVDSDCFFGFLKKKRKTKNKKQKSKKMYLLFIPKCKGDPGENFWTIAFSKIDLDDVVKPRIYNYKTRSCFQPIYTIQLFFLFRALPIVSENLKNWSSFFVFCRTWLEEKW